MKKTETFLSIIKNKSNIKRIIGFALTLIIETMRELAIKQFENQNNFIAYIFVVIAVIISLYLLFSIFKYFYNKEISFENEKMKNICKFFILNNKEKYNKEKTSPIFVDNEEIKWMYEKISDKYPNYSKDKLLNYIKLSYNELN